MDIIYKTKILSSLVKVFPTKEPTEDIGTTKLTALKGETVSFQVAYSSTKKRTSFLKAKINSPIKNCIKIRKVVNVPCEYPSHKEIDDNYLCTTPGLYPDLLQDLENHRVEMVANKWQSLWIDIEVTEDLKKGNYPITIEFYDYEEDTFLTKISHNITIYDVLLPKQKLIHTEWFHGDCLAEFYGVEVFSEKHWEIMENFIATAVKRGCNMILTPQFTPPLDTAKGFDRTTIQLVNITLEKGKYSFDFSNLERWVNMCKKIGITYFEMSHLFTQWGATSAPKIMATIDGEYKKLFGWHTEATSQEYITFLQSYLPELIEKLKKWNINKTTYFHISDEPTLEHVESYTEAKKIVAPLLKDFTIMDALSHYEFYKKGLVE
ncbi:MAG: glycoside hydrolase domain-containing protein, partial [Lachnospirales bacterium]